MKAAILALTFLAATCLVGCSSQSAELEKAKAEADAAKAESALLKAQMAELGVKPGSPANSEEAIKKAVKEFFGDLANGSLRGAYDSMSQAYQKRTDLKEFEQFIEKNPGLKLGASHISRMDGVTGVVCKARKLAKNNVYEYDIATNGEYTNYRRNINITLRLIQEEDRWKIDDFVEIKDRPL